MAQGFIYVLHFDSPLSHANHYVGSTTNPLKRLKRHAEGHGSKICRELHKLGIGFRLASLHSTNLVGMRRTERALKNQKNASRYCKFCNENPAGFEGCKEYPFEYTRSSAIEGIGENEILITREIKDYSLNSINTDIKELMSIEKDSLGFMPAGAGATGGIATLIKGKSLVVAMHKERCIGFCGYTRNMEKLRHKIHMCCVSDPYRFMQIGRKMVDEVIRDNDIYYPSKIACTVREDLSANVFWKNIGFEQVDFRQHVTSNSKLLDYQYSVDISNGEEIKKECE